MTNGKEVRIFAVDDKVADSIGGRYVCLLGEADGGRWFVEPTLFDLHSSVGNNELDWPYIERELEKCKVFALR